MSARKTWFLFITAAALAAFIFWVERPLRLARLKVPDNRLLPALDSAVVSAVEIQFPGRPTIRADRVNSGWNLVKPIQYPAAGEWIEALLTNLAQVRWEGHILPEELQGRPNALDDYGLANPRAILTLHIGEGRMQMLIGTNTPMADQIYLQQSGGSGVYLISPAVLGWIPDKPSIWRSRQLLDGFERTATALRVRSGGRGFDLERGSTNVPWLMVLPRPSRADNARITFALGVLATNRIMDFVADGVEDFERYGLQAPELEVLFGTNFAHGLQFGTSLTNNLVFARRPGEGTVFLVSQDVLPAWRGAPADFRDRRIVDAVNDSVTKIDVKGEETFSLIRTGTNAWRVSGKEEFPADKELMADVLTILTSDVTVPENPLVTDYKPYGLDQPLLEYRFAVSGERGGIGTNRVITAQFGVGETNRFFVRRLDEPSVSSLQPEDFLRLPRTAWQLRDRRVWNFAASNVVSVTVQQRGFTRKLARNAAGEWSVAAGSQGVVNPFGIEESVARLGELKAVFWSARGEAAEADSYGFKKNDYKLTLEVKRGTGTETLELKLGGPSHYQHPYAHTLVDGSPMIFEFPAQDYYSLVREFLSIFKTAPVAP